MPTRLASALLVPLCLCQVSAQQSAPFASGNTADAAPLPLAIHYDGPDVTLPVLIASAQPVVAPRHCDKVEDTATLLVVVDATGNPRDYYFIHATGSDLDQMALSVVAADRFRPGTAQGVPAAVAVADQITLNACAEKQKDPTGKKTYFLTSRSAPEQQLSPQSGPLESPFSQNRVRIGARAANPEPMPDGTYRVGGQVKDPWPINRVEAEYSDKGRREKISGACLITLVVDTHGMPQGLKMVRSLEPSMDANALAAVERYRFGPAMLNGEPVPVRITVEVNFRLYGRLY